VRLHHYAMHGFPEKLQKRRD